MCSEIVHSLDEIICAYEQFDLKIKPMLILEGKTDIEVYDKLLDYCQADESKYEVVIGGCKNTISKYMESGRIPTKYVALLDSDHGDRENSKYYSENIIYTHFYDMENYLTNIDVIYSTYKDFKGVRTNNINELDMINKMIEFSYQLILISEFKLRYLNEYKDIEDIYSIDIISSKDERFKNKTIQYKTKLSEEILRKYFDKNNLEFDTVLWNKCVNEANKLLNVNELELRTCDTYVQKLIKGRKLIGVYTIIFELIFGKLMKGRSKDVFTNDLRKNLIKSNDANLLVKDLDIKLNKIIS